MLLFIFISNAIKLESDIRVTLPVIAQNFRFVIKFYGERINNFRKPCFQRSYCDIFVNLSHNYDKRRMNGCILQ